MSIEAMKQALDAYCKTLHPLWNTRISRTEAEGFFEAGFKAAIEQAEKQEPMALKIYKPTPPRGAIPNVRDAELPWVYDQDPSSGYVASMWVIPVKATPQPQQNKKPSEGGDCDSPSWCKQYGKCHRKVVGAPTLANCIDERHEPWVWMPAPIKTQWGHDMVVADLAIDKDHTVSVYCERDQTEKVEAMFNRGC